MLCCQQQPATAIQLVWLAQWLAYWPAQWRPDDLRIGLPTGLPIELTTGTELTPVPSAQQQSTSGAGRSPTVSSWHNS